jgi:hypothetical protein
MVRVARMCHTAAYSSTYVDMLLKSRATRKTVLYLA